MFGRRHLASIAVFALAVQVAAIGAGVAMVCHEGPHRHGGLPAPDCAMHHAAVPEHAAATGHHHHGGAQNNDGGPTVRCHCSAEPVTFLIGEVAVFFGVSSVPSPLARLAAPRQSIEAVLDLTFPPVAPPPRYSLS